VGAPFSYPNPVVIADRTMRFRSSTGPMPIGEKNEGNLTATILLTVW
jgi:hypothetical protein